MSTVDVLTEKNTWKKLLLEQGITDVYFQYEYVKPMADHLGAKPILIHYSCGEGGFVYTLLVQDVADDIKFKCFLARGNFYDAETPYGYGGPFFYGDLKMNEQEVEKCRSKLKHALYETGIVSQFIRFNPLVFREGYSTIVVDKYGTYKSTVAIDLKDENKIITDLDPQYRRKIRKAVESGVIIVHDKGEKINEFIRLYNMTMKMHDADEMYFFKEGYYKSILTSFRENTEVFYALLGDKVVGSSIFLYDENYMHFHLGGRDIEAPKIPFENLLMVEAAKWGAIHGKKKLHIGGGLNDGDSLFQYKKKFNRDGILPFYIGRTIIDEKKYRELMRIRMINDPEFNPDNRYYIQYRF